MKFHLLKAKRGKRGHNLLQREKKGFLPETEYAEAAASREEATLMVSRNDEVMAPGVRFIRTFRAQIFALHQEYVGLDVKQGRPV